MGRAPEFAGQLRMATASLGAGQRCASERTNLSRSGLTPCRAARRHCGRCSGLLLLRLRWWCRQGGDVVLRLRGEMGGREAAGQPG